MQVLPNVETRDDYADALTLEQDTADTVSLVVANASALASFRPVARRGGADYPWGPEVLFTPQASPPIKNVSGVRIKSAVAGTPARVIAILTGPEDPQIAGGTPFSGTLAASGGVTPPATGGTVQVISDQLLSAAAASFQFANIPQTFAHLSLVVQARSTLAAVFDDLELRINNDVAAVYDYESMQGNSAVLQSNSANGATFVLVGAIAAGTAPAGAAGAGSILIPNYTNTTFWKTVSTDVVGTAHTGINLARMGVGQYRSALAVTALTLFPGAGNFLAGSRATLYGLGST